jgi:hypothetical protein
MAQQPPFDLPFLRRGCHGEKVQIRWVLENLLRHVRVRGEASTARPMVVKPAIGSSLKQAERFAQCTILFRKILPIRFVPVHPIVECSLEKSRKSLGIVWKLILASPRKMGTVARNVGATTSSVVEKSKPSASEPESRQHTK